MFLRALGARAAWIALALAAACDEGDARYAARFASDFSPARAAISVLGVYRDGRMSSDGWERFGGGLATALGAPCDVGYERLTGSNPVLAGAIDASARDDGPTDDLLGALAPAARGDVVMVLIVSGPLPRPASDAGVARSAPRSAPAGPGPFGSHHRANMAPATSRFDATGAPPFELSALLYSVSRRESVGRLTLQYMGASLEDALARFAEKFGQSLPGARCVGWDWGAAIDAERIRRSSEE